MKRCPSCALQKPLTEFHVRKTRNGAPASRCKPCSRDAQRKWRRTQPDYDKRRYQEVKVETRERHLVRKYGVNLETYNELLKAQNGKCAICGKSEADESHGVLHVDHCHNSGAVRGLLCRNCNHVLGLMKDNSSLVRAAADYLDSPPPQIPELLGRAWMEASA